MKPPKYASKKYQNTLKLLEQSVNLNEAMKDGLGSLGPLDKIRFERTLDSLKLKANMLGFLEAMEGGEVKGVSGDKLRIYSNWLTDAGNKNYPIYNHNAMRHINWFHKKFHGVEPAIADSIKRKMLRSLYLEAKDRADISNVKNIVLAGGGAKALSLTGSIKSLESHGADLEIKRVAGTSGGAIIAMMYASGYTAKDLEAVIKENEFGLFTIGSRFDNTIFNQWTATFSREKKSDLLHSLSDNRVAHYYHDRLMEHLAEKIKNHDDLRLKPLKSILGNSFSKDGKTLASQLSKLPNADTYFHSIVDILGPENLIAIDGASQAATMKKFEYLQAQPSLMLYSTPRKAIVNAMRHRSGQDIARGFFSDLVYNKLKYYPREELRVAFHGEEYRYDQDKTVSQSDLRNITFKQWQKLHEVYPERIKELHISVSIKRPFLERFEESDGNYSYDAYKHEDVSFENPEFCDMSVVDAVRISMNLPPIYQEYKFKLNGKEYFGSDGGLKSNMSLATFDDKYPTDETIGVFYKTEKELASAMDVERMLALPRKEKEILHEIDELNELEESKNIQLKTIDDALANNKLMSHDEIVYLDIERNGVIDEIIEIGGRLAATHKELQVVKNKSFNKGLAYNFGLYIQNKRVDDLGASYNWGRLAMVNTRDVGTADFKLSLKEKSEQIRYGEAAMDSLLNGSYCLENHFLYHHIDATRNKLITGELKNIKGLSSDVDNHVLSFLPSETEIVQDYGPSDNVDVQFVLDEMTRKARR
jgi:predicted acylesterase/phospholipase RssA